jgi:hypothetical protein
MVFFCLLLSIFSTIEQYEEVAGNILYYLVRATHHFVTRPRYNHSRLHEWGDNKLTIIVHSRWCCICCLSGAGHGRVVQLRVYCASVVSWMSVTLHLHLGQGTLHTPTSVHRGYVHSTV